MKRRGALPRVVATRLGFKHSSLHRDLADHLDGWRVFDCRTTLAKPELGEQQYRQAHIRSALRQPGSRSFAPRPARMAATLPDRTYRRVAQPLGVKADDQVVCYDAAKRRDGRAAVWLLRWVGHDAVRSSTAGSRNARKAVR